MKIFNSRIGRGIVSFLKGGNPAPAPQKVLNKVKKPSLFTNKANVEFPKNYEEYRTVMNRGEMDLPYYSDVSWYIH